MDNFILGTESGHHLDNLRYRFKAIDSMTCFGSMNSINDFEVIYSNIVESDKVWCTRVHCHLIINKMIYIMCTPRRPIMQHWRWILSQKSANGSRSHVVLMQTPQSTLSWLWWYLWQNCATLRTCKIWERSNDIHLDQFSLMFSFSCSIYIDWFLCSNCQGIWRARISTNCSSYWRTQEKVQYNST